MDSSRDIGPNPALHQTSRELRTLRIAAFVLCLASANLVVAQTSKNLFEELRDAGGIHPLAQLVCFPAAGQDLDTTFTLIAFSTDFAATLRKKAQPIPQEFLDAVNDSEKDRFMLQWTFRNGIQLHDEPETLRAMVGSKGVRWSADYSLANAKPKSQVLTLRMVFSVAGRYSRDVLVNGVLARSTYGKCDVIK